MRPTTSTAMRASSSNPIVSLFVLALAFMPQLTSAQSVFSYFKQSSCNAGTSFVQDSDTNPLSLDTSCHHFWNETVAVYMIREDEGCAIRAYLSDDCDPASVAGLLITVGTCFYVDDRVKLGSWRADCPGVDYSKTDGLDTGSSFQSASGDQAEANIEELLASATGVVTVTPTSLTASRSRTGTATGTQTPTVVATTVVVAPTPANAATGSQSGSGSGSGSAASATSTPGNAASAVSAEGAAAYWMASFAALVALAVAY